MTKQAFSISVPAEARFLKALRAFFTAVLADYGDADVEMVVLALDESCSNVMKHRAAPGGSGCVQVRVELEPGLARFAIDDFCGAEDVPNIKPRELSAVRPGGLGTHFVGEIMDRVEFEPDPQRQGKMVLVLEKVLRTEGDA